MIYIATSKNGIPIRLTDERWTHITIGHPEMSNYLLDVLETVEHPEIVYFGGESELLALKMIPGEANKYLVIVYKELSDQTGTLIDGFIITAYSTSRKNSFLKRSIAWQP